MTTEITYLINSLLSSVLWFALGAVSMWLYLHPQHHRSAHHRKGHRR